MSGIKVDFTIKNQKGTPAFYSDIFANRPSYGYPGRVFISTDTGAIYEDTGSAWTLIADAGAGTTGTLQQVTTNGNTTTLGIQVQGIDINKGTGTGANNIAIGSTSLSSNTTGANNVSVGQSSLTTNTTGTQNTAIGVSALNSNTTGSGNTSLGYSSLSSNTTGNYNIALGSGNGNTLTTGQYNTLIGYNTGNGITTGSSNTIIGGNISGLSTTLSNNIILADGSGNVRLFSDANGLIAINQAVGSTIGGQLDIHTSQTYALVLNGLTTNNAYTAFSNNSVGQWRTGNTYNAGANTYDIFNLGTSSSALSFNKTTNNATFIANVTASSLIKSGGTSAQILAADGSVITAGTNITISGGTIASSGGGSMAIGGSITSATAGSVLYAGAGGVLAQSNANFYYDYTNNRLGLGTTTIGSSFQVNGSAAIGYSASTAAATNGLLVNTDIQTNTGKIGVSVAPFANTLSTGSIDLANGAGLFGYTNQTYLTSNLYYNTNFTYKATAGACLFNLTNTGDFVWQTVPSGTINTTATLTERLRLTQLGNLGIGTSTIGSKLQVNGSVAIGFSASTSAPTNGLSVTGTTNIGTNTSVTTALLQVASTTQGFLPPVMTTTQKNAITSPATGLVVFDSTLGKLCVFSTTWQTITSV